MASKLAGAKTFIRHIVAGEFEALRSRRYVFRRYGIQRPD